MKLSSVSRGADARRRYESQASLFLNEGGRFLLFTFSWKSYLKDVLVKKFRLFLFPTCLKKKNVTIQPTKNSRRPFLPLPTQR